MSGHSLRGSEGATGGRTSSPRRVSIVACNINGGRRNGLFSRHKRERRYAGSNETDEAGRRHDRREFDATIDALSFLETCQNNWHRNRGGRYRDDLLTMIGDHFRGLPEESGIELKVSGDGQSWYAWRRTITGWWFAIGAAGPPPDRWEFDGADPPQDFPGRDAVWGDRPFAADRNRNWQQAESIQQV